MSADQWADENGNPMFGVFIGLDMNTPAFLIEHPREDGEEKADG